MMEIVTKTKGCHYSDILMSTIASQITGVSIVCWNVGSGVNQRKHQSSASLGPVRGIHLWPVNSPHQGPVTQQLCPIDDVIKIWSRTSILYVKDTGYHDLKSTLHLFINNGYTQQQV